MDSPKSFNSRQKDRYYELVSKMVRNGQLSDISTPIAGRLEHKQPVLCLVPMETSELKEIIDQALQESISYEEYSDLLQSYAREEKTSGPSQNEDLIYYTKLNAQRSKRIARTVQLREGLVSQIKSINKKQTWLLITETWCGDAANSVPVIAKLAKLNPQITLRLVFRDEQLKLMDQFLTNGRRSIPKLIVLDSEMDIVFTWGPRPETGQKLYASWKNSENRIPYREYQVELQKWYNQDGGNSLQEEFSELLLGEENMKSRTAPKLAL